jgi:hypothetical protein
VFQCVLAAATQDGDMAAAKLLIDRVILSRREAPVSFHVRPLKTPNAVEAVRRRALSLSAPCYQADFFAHLTDERRLGREGPETKLRLEAAAQPVG